jgi:tRNA dimethylallyltransferase
VAKLKQASRNYAKRQLTWFRHMEGVTWLEAGSPDLEAQAEKLAEEFLSECGDRDNAEQKAKEEKQSNGSK